MQEEKFKQICEILVKDKIPTPSDVKPFLESSEFYELFANSTLLVYCLMTQIMTIHSDDDTEEIKRKHAVNSFFFPFLLGVEFQKQAQEIAQLEKMNEDSH